jgi:hypothetical protein
MTLLSWRRPDTVSVFCEVAAAQTPALRVRLAAGRSRLGLDRLPGVHFLRLLVLEPDHDLRGRPLPARLILSLVFDGTAVGTLTSWVGLAGDELVDIFSRCTGGPSEPAEVVPFLLARSIRPDTYHVGTPRSTVTQILQERRLAEELREFVRCHLRDAGSSLDPAEVRRQALAFVRTRPDLPQLPRPARPAGDSLRQAVDFAVTGAVVASGSMLAGAGMGLVRYLERTEPDVVVRQDDDAVAALEAAEDLDVQNQFTMVASVRDSEARRLLLRTTLFLSDGFSKFLANTGQLVGVETIHYARIHQFDGGRRFLFMSDFDGSWSRYLFDFLTTGSFAVVPNWTNLLGCPKTEFLIQPGPGFSQRFLPFTRARQVGTDVWYSAYPGLTVTDIGKHAEIRRGLFTSDGPTADRWVRLL